MFEKNKFLEEEIPYEKFRMIGIDRKQVLELPPQVLKDLLEGRVTQVVQGRVATSSGNEYAVPVKLQLTHDAEGKVQLMTYPLRDEIANTLDLSKTELEQVKKGEVIRKEITEKDGTRRQKFVQLDPETKSLMHRDVASVKIGRQLEDVEKIRDIQLGQNQKQAALEGKPVELTVDDQKVTVGVDLREPQCFKVMTGDMDEWKRQREIRYDVAHPEVMGYVQTDENRWEYQQVYLREQREKLDESKKEQKNHGLKL